MTVLIFDDRALKAFYDQLQQDDFELKVKPNFRFFKHKLLLGKVFFMGKPVIFNRQGKNHATNR